MADLGSLSVQSHGSRSRKETASRGIATVGRVRKTDRHFESEKTRPRLRSVENLTERPSRAGASGEVQARDSRRESESGTHERQKERGVRRPGPRPAPAITDILWRGGKGRKSKLGEITLRAPTKLPHRNAFTNKEKGQVPFLLEDRD